MKKYLPANIEPRWQKRWREDRIYQTDLSQPKDKFYLLVEFTYPSGDLHMGHWFTFSSPDILARMKRMQGFRVFFPNGFDAFGLPAENAAIKRGIHPKDWTYANIKRMKEQFSTMGASFTWDNEVITCDPVYYRWNQWIFLKMWERGLSYRAKTLSNWCPSCQTVLANENIEAGRCWRCEAEVVQKEVEQWFLKITNYAEKLLWSDPPKADWPKALREGQNNWIGKSKGVVINFNSPVGELEVFTTRPDTLFGATFVVISPEHRLLKDMVTKEQRPQVEKYLERAWKKSELERKEGREKTGVFTGSFVKNPLTKEDIPVWVADYVLSGYGTGAIMGVPAHDGRDFEFAQKYGLEIRQVIAARGPVLPVGSPRANVDARRGEAGGSPLAAYEGEGILVNSGRFIQTSQKPSSARMKRSSDQTVFLKEKPSLARRFIGLTSQEAREKISDYIVKNQLGKYQTEYHLHDWSISRQRYWGTPIPIIYCDKCGIVPVPEKDLPVELPYKVDYAPQGKSPLATAEEWVKVICPKCGGEGKREVETMDTFVDSSWYFLRFLDPKNRQEIFDRKVIKDWMPLEIYFGGTEHTTGHALYSRFFTKFFYDLKLLDFEEYGKRRVHHGVVLGSDGEKMSKSRGNVVSPDEEVKKYGADAMRLYLAFFMPYEATGPWNPKGIWGPYRFLERVWRMWDRVTEDSRPTTEDLRRMHQTIKQVTGDIEAIKLNTAVAHLMEWLNYLSKKEGVFREEYKTFLLLLAPFAPHITEELWEILKSSVISRQSSDKNSLKADSEATPKAGEAILKTDSWSIHQQSWPQFNPAYFKEEKLKMVIQVDGKVRDELVVGSEEGKSQQVMEKLAFGSPKVAKYCREKSVKRIIFLPGKLINLVT